MKLKGIDCSVPVSRTSADALYQLGYRFICRYLVPETYPKSLSAGEAQALTDAGFNILSVFETTAGRAGGGADNGAADGATAYQCAKNIAMPTGGTIFFAVDFDAAAKDYDAIEAYLRSAAAQTGAYKVGVYGSYYVIEEMAKRGACAGYWQTYAWSGGNLPKSATVYQYLNDQTAAGISVDLNEATSLEGLWNLNDTGSDLNMTIDEARNELTTMDGTGAAHSAWSDTAVSKLVKAGIFTGDGAGNYGWEQCITREAVAEILYNVLGKLGQLDKI